jgi:uncharacterized protein YrrD
MQSLKFTLNKKVLSSHTQKIIGEIKEGVIDPDTGRIIAFKLKTLLPKKFLSIVDIVEFNEDKILIHSEGGLFDEKDLPRIKQIKELKLKIWKAKAFSESGDCLGRVDDLIFDEHSGEIIKYYISQPFFLNPLKTHLIVTKNEILRVEKKGIIVRDPSKKVVVGALS